MHLTPARLAAVYDCLREFPPFSSWKVPDSDAVEFRVSMRVDRFGLYELRDDQHTIEISAVLVIDWQTLVESVAHEMVHLHQARAGTETRAEHNREWHRLAKTVCDSFGWNKDNF